MTTTLAAVHLHDGPRANNLIYEAYLTNGSFAYLSYTRIDCSLARSPANTGNKYTAHPQTNDTVSLITAFGDFYNIDLFRQSASNASFTIPPGYELFRFYQAYMIPKDTIYKELVTRVLNVGKPTVELSTIF